MSKILTIDGNNLVHRVYYVANNMPHKSEYLHVYMFLNSVKSYVEMYRPDKVYCVWDEKLVYKPNKRLELLPEYKGNIGEEKSKEAHTKNWYAAAAKEKAYIIEIIQKLLQSIGISSILPLEYEADDVIAIINDTITLDDHVVVYNSINIFKWFIANNNTNIEHCINKKL